MGTVSGAPVSVGEAEDMLVNWVVPPGEMFSPSAGWEEIVLGLGSEARAKFLSNMFRGRAHSRARMVAERYSRFVGTLSEVERARFVGHRSSGVRFAVASQRAFPREDRLAALLFRRPNGRPVVDRSVFVRRWDPLGSELVLGVGPFSSVEALRLAGSYHPGVQVEVLRSLLVYGQRDLFGRAAARVVSSWVRLVEEGDAASSMKDVRFLVSRAVQFVNQVWLERTSLWKVELYEPEGLPSLKLGGPLRPWERTSVVSALGDVDRVLEAVSSRSRLWVWARLSALRNVWFQPYATVPVADRSVFVGLFNELLERSGSGRWLGSVAPETADRLVGSLVDDPYSGRDRDVWEPYFRETFGAVHPRFVDAVFDAVPEALRILVRQARNSGFELFSSDRVEAVGREEGCPLSGCVCWFSVFAGFGSGGDAQFPVVSRLGRKVLRELPLCGSVWVCSRLVCSEIGRVAPGKGRTLVGVEPVWPDRSLSELLTVV